MENKIAEDTNHVIYEDEDGKKTLYCLYPDECKINHGNSGVKEIFE